MEVLCCTIQCYFTATVPLPQKLQMNLCGTIGKFSHVFSPQIIHNSLISGPDTLFCDNIFHIYD